jgi:hypothetical protein
LIYTIAFASARVKSRVLQPVNTRPLRKAMPRGLNVIDMKWTVREW